MEVRILGPLQVVLDSGQVLDLGDGQSRLVACLAIACAPVLLDDLARSMSDDPTRPLGRRALDLHVAAAQSALGTTRLRVTDQDAHLELGRGELDANEFEREASAGLAAYADADPVAARGLIEAALSRWRGEVLGGNRLPGTIVTVDRLTVLRTRARQALDDLDKRTADDADKASRVTTFLMTDVVGSTAQWEIAPEGMHAALAVHDSTITDIVTRCGGRCIKHRGEGDSTFSVFDDPADAVRAAAAILRAISTTSWPGGVDINVRASVYTGSAIERDGDYYGAVVNRAARLRSKARRGQALVSGSAAASAIGRLPETLLLERVGMLTMQDIPDAEEVFELVDRHHRGSAGADSPGPAVPAEGRRRWATLPVPLRSASTSFSGRVEDLALLVEAFRQARRGSGRVVLLGGDPGIGKTRLTAEFSRRALLDGAIVAFGRSDPEGGLPFRTFVDALSELVAIAPESLLDRYVHAFGGELSRIVPLLARRARSVPPPTTADAGTERHLLFDAARGLLEHVAVDGPVLLVLDDLHDASAETVLLTRFLIDEAPRLPLLIVGTYRDSEVAADSPYGRLLSHVRRAGHATIHTLTGLRVAEVASLVQELLPDSGGLDDVATWLVDETGGNPLFSIELLRSHSSVGGSAAFAATPTDSVRDVIGRRVERLGSEVLATLTRAALIGRSFDLSLVAGSLGISDEAVLSCLETAVDAHLVEEGSLPGTFTFAHGLIAHVLEASLTSARRTRAHLAVADAIDVVRGSQTDGAIDAQARHLVAAAPLADRDRTLTATRRAGDHAMAKLAPGQAAGWYSAARNCVDEDSRESIELSIAVGAAQRQAGDRSFRATLLAASKAALDGGHHDLLLAAVVANHRGVRARTFFVDHERVAMLRAAIASCRTESSDKARALAALASELTHDPDEEARLAFSDEALAIARRLGDDEAICEIVASRLDSRLPPDPTPVLDLSEELVAIASRIGDERNLSFGLLSRAQTHMQMGDMARHDADIARAKAAVGRVTEPFVRWRLASHDAYRAAIAGDLGAAERAALACYALAKRDGQPDAEAVLASHLLILREAQGRLGELLDGQRKAVASIPDSAALRSVFAFVLAECGHTDEARMELDRFVAVEGRIEVVRDLMWMMAMAYLGRASVAANHVAAARFVIEEITPWSGQVVWSGSCALGPVDTVLSRCALVIGDAQSAVDRARAGLATSRAMVAPLWTVEALEAEALALTALDDSTGRAQHALAEAAELAVAHGYAQFIDRFERPGTDQPGTDQMVSNA